jgi:integrase
MGYIGLDIHKKHTQVCVKNDIGTVRANAERWTGIRFRIQTLRATFGQMCKDRGASIEAVSRALRHSTTVTTERYYARIRPEDAFREIEDAFNRPRRAR